MTTSEIIENAAKLVLQPSRVIGPSERASLAIGVMAVDRRGRPVSPKKSNVARVCGIGAVYHVMRVDPEATDGRVLTKAGIVLATLDHAAQRLFLMPFSSVCDRLDHGDLVDVYRDAWKDAKATERLQALAEESKEAA